MTSAIITTLPEKPPMLASTTDDAANALYSVISKTRAARLYTANRLKREGWLLLLVLISANILTIGAAIFVPATPVAAMANAVIIVLSIVALVTSAYIAGAKPDTRLHQVYEATKSMSSIMYEIESVRIRGNPSQDRVDELRQKYLALLGDIDSNHSPADYAFTATVGFKSAMPFVSANRRTVFYLLTLVGLWLLPAYLLLIS